MESEPGKKITDVHAARYAYGKIETLFNGASNVDISLGLSHLAKTIGIDSVIPVTYVVEMIPDSDTLRILAMIAGPMKNNEIAAMTVDDQVKMVAMVDPISEFLESLLQKAGARQVTSRHANLPSIEHMVSVYGKGIRMERFLAAAETTYQELKAVQKPSRLFPGH